MGGEDGGTRARGLLCKILFCSLYLTGGKGGLPVSRLDNCQDNGFGFGFIILFLAHEKF